MLFSELLKELSVGETKHTPDMMNYLEGSPAEKENAIHQIMIYANEGLREFHAKYDLQIGTYTYGRLSTDSLRIPDHRFVNLIKIVDAGNNEYVRPTYVGQLTWDYDLQGVGTIVFNPTSEAVYGGRIVYRKLCAPIRLIDDPIDLYDSMLNLLKAYMSYRLSTPNGASASTEQNLYYARYMAQLKLVEEELGVRNDRFLNKPKRFHGEP